MINICPLVGSGNWIIATSFFFFQKTFVASRETITQVYDREYKMWDCLGISVLSETGLFPSYRFQLGAPQWNAAKFVWELLGCPEAKVRQPCQPKTVPIESVGSQSLWFSFASWGWCFFCLRKRWRLFPVNIFSPPAQYPICNEFAVYTLPLGLLLVTCLFPSARGQVDTFTLWGGIKWGIVSFDSGEWITCWCFLFFCFVFQSSLLSELPCWRWARPSELASAEAAIHGFKQMKSTVHCKTVWS